MYPPIFAACNVPAVQALLRATGGPLRFWMFGQAPQKTVYPYAVWRWTFGSPENYLSGRPDTDAITITIDVYASPDQGPSVARSVADALRDAVEGHAHITAWRGESRDPQTESWNSSFDVDFIVDR